MRRLLYVFIIVIFIAGCGSTFKVTTLDPETGYFPAKKAILPENIKVSEKLDLFHFKLIYVKYENDFLKRSIQNIHFFEQVVIKEEFEQLLITKDIINKLPNLAVLTANIENPISLNQIQKYYGDFLVVELLGFKPPGSLTIQGAIKVSNPATGQTVFEVRNEASAWLSVDEYLFYPLLNAFYDWVKNNSGR